MAAPSEPAPNALAGGETVATVTLAGLLDGTNPPAPGDTATSQSLVAAAVVMPSAATLQSLRDGEPTVAEDANATGVVGRVLADALGGGANAHAIDALLDAVSGHARTPDHLAEVIADHVSAPWIVGWCIQRTAGFRAPRLHGGSTVDPS